MDTFSEYCMRHLSDLKYSLMIVIGLTLMFSFAIIVTYSVLHLVKRVAVLLPEERRLEVTLKCEYYIKKLNELLESFRL